MPPYRATLGGAFGGGTQRAPAQGLDFGSIIDAIAGGASGLIHQAYTRKQTEHAQRRQDEDRQYQRTHQQEQLQLERQKEDRQREHEARMELASGILRGGTSITRRPDPLEEPPRPTIADAFARGFDAPGSRAMPHSMPHSVLDAGSGGALPGSVLDPGSGGALTTPVRVGSLGRVPSYDVETTPDRYDPAQDRVRIRTLDAAAARRPAAAAAEPSWQTVEGADGFVQVNPKTGQTRPVVGIRPKPRAGARDAAALSPTQENQLRLQQIALMNVRRAIKDLRDGVKKMGTEIRPGADKSRLTALVSNAQIKYKEAAKLGVLAGPDMGIIINALGDPTSPTQFLRGGADGVLSSLEAVDEGIVGEASTLKSIYGRDMPAEFESLSARPAPAAHVQTIDEMISAGASNAQIKAAMRRGVK